MRLDFDSAFVVVVVIVVGEVKLDPTGSRESGTSSTSSSFPPCSIFESPVTLVSLIPPNRTFFPARSSPSTMTSPEVRSPTPPALERSSP